VLQKAYNVLSDPKKRERYDQWGDDGSDTFNSTEWMNAYEYYRSMHPEITKSDFKSYIDGYRFSETENNDLLEFYEKYDGDMRGLLENIIASENSDVERFIKYYQDQIKAGTLKSTPKFQKTYKQVRLLQDEKVEAKKEK
jgi:DnaJ family protein C protein 9